MKITREEIVTAALALLTETGLDKLSTRGLAERLGVQQPALYWHFKNKRALMDAMNAEIMRSAYLHRAPPEGADWRSFLTDNAQSFRAALLKYRDGARIHAGSRAEESDRDNGEMQLAYLVSAGFSLSAALRALLTVSRFTVGFVLEEQAEAENPPVLGGEGAANRPLLQQAFADYTQADQDSLFSEGLNLIMDGIESGLARAHEARS